MEIYNRFFFFAFIFRILKKLQGAGRDTQTSKDQSIAQIFLDTFKVTGQYVHFEYVNWNWFSITKLTDLFNIEDPTDD